MCVVSHCYTFKQPIPVKETTYFINVTLISIKSSWYGKGAGSGLSMLTRSIEQIWNNVFS